MNKMMSDSMHSTLGFLLNSDVISRKIRGLSTCAICHKPVDKVDTMLSLSGLVEIRLCCHGKNETHFIAMTEQVMGSGHKFEKGA